MRRINITDSAGNPVGAITEDDAGNLAGEGKGESLLEQAPTRTYEEWLEGGHHSKYLHYQEEPAG